VSHERGTLRRLASSLGQSWVRIELQDPAEGGRELGAHVIGVLGLLELVRVDVERDRWTSVAELSRDPHDVEPLADKVRAVGVPEIRGTRASATRLG
jgi:hypothetical protein